MQTAEQLKEIVKDKYSDIARESDRSCCTESSCCGDYSGQEGYYAEADLGLGCGIPTQFAQIGKGHTVLDLGSGAGNDVFIARSLVGEKGKVIGVDMTEEMIEKAKQNQAKLGYQNVEFRLGEIENLPLTANEVDVIVSNCVLNLVPDKAKSFREMYRVLKPGGHFCVSDIVLNGELPAKLKSVAEMYAGCISGAIDKHEYLQLLRDAGFRDLETKKDRQIVLSEAILSEHLDEVEIEAYRKSGANLASITVYGQKPSRG